MGGVSACRHEDRKSHTKVAKVLEGSCWLLPGIAINAPAELVEHEELFQGIKIGF
jgi:hypothetical protein